MSRPRALSLLAVALAGPASLAACNELPPLTAEGEHVSIGSDVLPEVCAGTVANYDFVSEYLADRFGVEPQLVHELYFVSDGSTKSCGDGRGCATESRVIVLVGDADGDSSVRTVAVHELAHNYSLSLSGRGRPFLEEGLASAMDTGCISSGTELDILLEAPTSTKLGLAGGYCEAGNFMRWLVETEGPKAVLDFKRSVSSRGKAGPVKQAYTKHFGRSLSEDFSAHREETRVRRVYECFPALAAALEGPGSYRLLEVETSCDDPRVENSFSNPEDVLVRWRLEVLPGEAGPWQLLGSLGTGETPVELRIGGNECYAPTTNGASQLFALAGSLPRRLWLGPGAYTLTLRTPYEATTRVEQLLSGPCTLGAGDCQAGHRCDGEVCIPAASDPLPLGVSCAQGFDGDPCAQGSRCVGPPLSSSTNLTFDGRCVGLCLQDADCPLDQRCHASGLCGDACDPTAPACIDTDLCVSGWNDSASVCLPDARISDSTTCRHDNGCPTGFVCERPGLGEGEIGCGSFSPCACEQLCSLAEEDASSCPEDRPVCVADPDGLRATCQRAAPE